MQEARDGGTESLKARRREERLRNGDRRKGGGGGDKDEQDTGVHHQQFPVMDSNLYSIYLSTQRLTPI